MRSFARNFKRDLPSDLFKSLGGNLINEASTTTKNGILMQEVESVQNLSKITKKFKEEIYNQPIQESVKKSNAKTAQNKMIDREMSVRDQIDTQKGKKGRKIYKIDT